MTRKEPNGSELDSITNMKNESSDSQIQVEHQPASEPQGKERETELEIVHQAPFLFSDIMFSCRRMLLYIIVLSLINSSFSSEQYQNVNDRIEDYIEYLGRNIAIIENEDLKSEIEDLFKQFIPGLEQILQLETISMKLKLLRDILPELFKIEQLLNEVNNIDERNIRDKQYRLADIPDDSVVDKDILLTIYEQFEDEDEKLANLPPWFPDPNQERQSVTELPYRVNMKNEFVITH